MKSQRVIYFKFKVNVFLYHITGNKKVKTLCFKNIISSLTMYNYEGVFILYIHINLLFRFLMSIHFFKFTETDLGKCMTFILVKNVLDQNPNKKCLEKIFLHFVCFSNLRARFSGFFSRSFFHFFLLLFKQRYK